MKIVSLGKVDIISNPNLQLLNHSSFYAPHKTSTKVEINRTSFDEAQQLTDFQIIKPTYLPSLRLQLSYVDQIIAIRFDTKIVLSTILTLVSAKGKKDQKKKVG